MRRWNGWGDDTIDYPVPSPALDFLKQHIGEATPTHNIDLSSVVKHVPASRLAAHSLITTDAEERVRHARGQSLPDWLAYRSGKIPAFPDGVAYPTTAEEVRDLLRYAKNRGAHLIPYGGGTSVVGHINPPTSDTPILTINLSRLNELKHLDPKTNLATFEAGIVGPELEAQLRAQGYTLGHFPQSFEYSTLGGWIATRSSGQQSLHYGRIENLFVGGTIETPLGTLAIPNVPASAAGPNLREVILGSEGRFGIITEATVRISPQPDLETFRAIFFPDFDRAMAAAREMVQARLPLSMVRLSNALETETTLKLAGHERAIQFTEGLLKARGIHDHKCLLMVGYTGKRGVGKATLGIVSHIAQKYQGIYLPYIGKVFGNQWRKSRFRTPYLRNTLWEIGYAVDTLETATTWDKTPSLMKSIETSLHQTAATFNEKIHVFSHLSHVYPHGSSIYTTYIFRIHPDTDTLLDRWQHLKHAASQAIVEHGATISHQHGVGIDHAPYLAAEKGELGMQTLRTLANFFDPDGIMNPSKLLV